jgi:hypothetical protein
MLLSQCSCFGASIGGLTPVGGTTNIGVIKKNNLRANIFYKYIFGDKYFRGDIPLSMGDIKSYYSHYFSFNTGYGITNDVTLEGELGFFSNKTQDFRYWKESMSGLSHVMLSGKYNVFNSVKSEFEFTAGISARIPFPVYDDSAFKFVDPSTGAWNFGLSLFAYKGFNKSGFHFFLINRTEFNTKNKYGYIFGPSNYTSLFSAYEVFPFLTGIIELRNEWRLRDYIIDYYVGESGGNKIYTDKYAGDSGGDIIFISPQINFNISSFNLSLIFDYPLYGLYNGTQLANNYSVGLNAAWNFSFNK